MSTALTSCHPAWTAPRAPSSLAAYVAAGALIVFMLLPALAAPAMTGQSLNWHGNSAGVSSGY